MYITQYDPPEARVRYVDGGIELKFTEAAVMLAFAFHLLEQAEGEAEIFIHPDGEHAKVFDVASFLVRRGFEKTKVIGKTPYGGRYARCRRRGCMHTCGQNRTEPDTTRQYRTLFNTLIFNDYLSYIITSLGLYLRVKVNTQERHDGSPKDQR